MQATGNSNEWINWIDDAISRNLVKYYEYNHFYNIKEIGSGSFGKVYRANWKNSNKYLALKSFTSFNNVTAKEIVKEVIIACQSFITCSRLIKILYSMKFYSPKEFEIDCKHSKSFESQIPLYI